MKSRRLNGQNSQENLSKKLQQVQGELDEVSKNIEEMSFMGISGGGAAEVVLKGSKLAESIKISEEAKKDLEKDKDSLENILDLIVAAFNDALQKIDSYTDNEISNITKGLNIPGLK